ncbi:MAG: hypothetical protein U0167_00360 [bacterium]
MTLFASVDTDRHNMLRAIARDEGRSIADVVREALDAFLERAIQRPRWVGWVARSRRRAKKP